MSAQVLRLLGLPAHDVGEEREFCGHCGKEPASGHASRVCGHCDLGLILRADARVAPTPADAFLVVDGQLAVCALSAAAEKLLGVAETVAVNRHLGEFLLPADANAQSGGSLLDLVVAAASGPGQTLPKVRVRPLGVFGVRFSARIGRCGPAPSAIIVLES